MKYFHKSAFAGTILFPLGIVLLLGISGTMEIMNRKFSDLLFSLKSTHHTFSKDVVIVDIDENTLALFANDPQFGRWPWKRSVYPDLISYIEMGSPKMVLFDILFTESSPEDSSLENLNSSYDNISHAINMRTDVSKKGLGEFERSKALKINVPEDFKTPRFSSISLPAGQVGNSSKWNHVVNILPDKDGVIRRFSPIVRIEESYFPTLPLGSLLNENELSLQVQPDSFILNRNSKSELLPMGSDGFVRSFFYSREELYNIPRYSASGIFTSLAMLREGEDLSKLITSPELFTDKIVIIGTTAAATHDDVVTPFGLFPGVIAQAVFTSNLVEGHFLREISPIYGYIIVLVSLILSTWVLFFYDRQIARLLIPIVMPSVIGILFYVLYTRDYVLPIAPFLISFPISFLFGFAYITYKEGQEKRKYNSILRNLVDPSVVSQALVDMEALREGGEWEITAFFSDVAGFSSISEELTPKQLASLLNEYLSAMTDILKHHHGTLDKYIGDAIVGIFGAPIKNSNHPLDACSASLKMVLRLEDLRKGWNENQSYTPAARAMTFRIGLNCGVAKVGFMGTESLASYTMMGDMVNLASRLEAAAKDYGTMILVSESIYESCKQEYYFRFMDRIRVKGKDQPVEIYSLESKLSEVSDSNKKAGVLYKEAFLSYTQQNWSAAIEGFQEVEKLLNKKDKASRMLIERCTQLSENPPPKEWNGVYTRTVK